VLPAAKRTSREDSGDHRFNHFGALMPAAMGKMSKAILSDSDGVIVGGSPSTRPGIKIEAIENDLAKKAAKDVAWLGSRRTKPVKYSRSIGTQSPGRAWRSLCRAEQPGCKGGSSKYDVLVGMEPGAGSSRQLRKLVRRQKEGDSIKLEFIESERSNQSQRHLARRPIVPMQTTRCLMWSRIS